MDKESVVFSLVVFPPNKMTVKFHVLFLSNAQDREVTLELVELHTIRHVKEAIAEACGLPCSEASTLEVYLRPNRELIDVLTLVDIKKNYFEIWRGGRGTNYEVRRRVWMEVTKDGVRQYRGYHRRDLFNMTRDDETGRLAVAKREDATIKDMVGILERHCYRSSEMLQADKEFFERYGLTMKSKLSEVGARRLRFTVEERRMVGPCVLS